MRLSKTGLILGTVAMLGTTAPAFADEVRVEGAHEPSSTVGVVAKDGLFGGLAGAAVGGGILLIRNQGFDGRIFGISTGVGLLAGVGLGLLDAASQAPVNTASVLPDIDRVARPEVESKMASNTGLPASVDVFQHSGRF